MRGGNGGSACWLTTFPKPAHISKRPLTFQQGPEGHTKIYMHTNYVVSRQFQSCRGSCSVVLVGQSRPLYWLSMPSANLTHTSDLLV
jgi:hypothetical protein